MSQTKTVSAFPFDELQHYSKNDIDLQRKILKQYSFLSDSKDVLNHFLVPLKSFLPDAFEINLLNVSGLKFKDLKNRFSQKGLYSLIKVLPHNKMAFFSFDPILAKVLVSSALTGGKWGAIDLSDQQIQPLTALEEGVVEYLVVSCLDQIEKQFQKKDFSFTYESILSDPQKLDSFFSHQEEFAVFSFLLSHAKKDFHFHLALPISLGKDLGWQRTETVFLKNRMGNFLNFKMDFEVEVGFVELTANDLSELQEGDIVLLDEVNLKKTTSGFQGSAAFKPTTSLEDSGYKVELTPKGENFVAEIKGVL